MFTWKLYSWIDFDPYNLPWSCQSEVEVMPSQRRPLRLEKLSDPTDRGRATEFGFDPEHTYYTWLTRVWNEHPVGSRVLLDADRIAIETKHAASSRRTELRPRRALQDVRQ
jgi:hypothetical protein